MDNTSVNIPSTISTKLRGKLQRFIIKLFLLLSYFFSVSLYSFTYLLQQLTTVAAVVLYNTMK